MMKKLAIFLLLCLTLIGISSCKTKEVPGRVRAPRRCNTCTKWSYVPQQPLESELLFRNEG